MAFNSFTSRMVRTYVHWSFVLFGMRRNGGVCWLEKIGVRNLSVLVAFNSFPSRTARTYVHWCSVLSGIGRKGGVCLFREDSSGKVEHDLTREDDVTPYARTRSGAQAGLSSLLPDTHTYTYTYTHTHSRAHTHTHIQTRTWVGLSSSAANRRRPFDCAAWGIKYSLLSSLKAKG